MSVPIAQAGLSNRHLTYVLASAISEFIATSGAIEISSTMIERIVNARIGWDKNLPNRANSIVAKTAGIVESTITANGSRDPRSGRKYGIPISLLTKKNMTLAIAAAVAVTSPIG